MVSVHTCGRRTARVYCSPHVAVARATVWDGDACLRLRTRQNIWRVSSETAPKPVGHRSNTHCNRTSRFDPNRYTTGREELVYHIYNIACWCSACGAKAHSSVNTPAVRSPAKHGPNPIRQNTYTDHAAIYAELRRVALLRNDGPHWQHHTTGSGGPNTLVYAVMNWSRLY